MPIADATIPGLAESIRTKLQGAPGPLKLSEVAKGLPKPKKLKAADFQNELRGVLQEQVQLGLAFSYPSGKNGEDRYWSRDEKNLLRTKAVEGAATPQTLAGLVKLLGKEVRGADKGFVESVVREMIRDDKLFEYPPKTKKSGPLFGASRPAPPAPPLELPKHKKAVDKLVKDAEKLIAAAEVSVDDLLRVLTDRLKGAMPATGAPALTPNGAPAGGARSNAPPTAELDELVLKAVAHAPVLSLKDLREMMPGEYRGLAFNDAVLRLARHRRVVVFQDDDASRYSEAERREYVQDGPLVYTTIAKRD